VLALSKDGPQDDDDIKCSHLVWRRADLMPPYYAEPPAPETALSARDGAIPGSARPTRGRPPIARAI